MGRLFRKAILEYSVAAVFALLLAGGALRYVSLRKRYTVAPTDEEMLEESAVPTETE